MCSWFYGFLGYLLGMDWLGRYEAALDCWKRLVSKRACDREVKIYEEHFVTSTSTVKSTGSS